MEERNTSAAGSRAAAQNFQDLLVWRKAHEFVLGIYRFSSGFPASELYGLTNQLRRAAVSIPANIAEGFRKRGPKDKIRFLNTAEGSLEESRYYLILAKDLGYGDSTTLLRQLEEASKMLSAYSRAILSSVS
jgi:four helix bundle protein